MARAPGPSARVKLTLSYVAFLLVAGALLLGAVWLFLLRYVPDESITSSAGFVPNQSDLLRAFAPAATAVMLFLLVLGLVGGWLLAGRMLAPLERITATARHVAAGSLAHRVRLEGPRDEFRELADTFDTMLDMLEAHVAEQRRFAANASHELRTPLAIQRTLIDVARSDPDRDVDTLLDRLRTVNTRAAELTDSLLLLSRADAHGIPHSPVDLSLLAEEAWEDLLPLAERRRTRVENRLDPAVADGAEGLLGPLVRNLLQNAVVHNLPADGIVLVHTGIAEGRAFLRVENTGATLAADVAATLTEPFQRAGGRVRDPEHAGAGLGLAIAARVVRAHGGTLLLEPRDGGGLIVTALLPVPSR